ncbi:MAG: hypothetical protein JHC33_05600 [Ignisphaera sp.]|nr:hypothetical protein [Ignisphaera sp.]
MEDIVVDNEEVLQTAPEPSPVDSEARLMGWVPKEEFRGPEEHWIDSETFVERGRSVLPIVKKNNQELTKKLLALEAKDREREVTIAEWKSFMKETQQRERATLEQEITALKAQKRQAISDGDGDAVVDIDEAIDAIKDKQREVKVEVPQPTNQPDPAFIEWVGDNSWYGTDEDKTAYANGIGPAVQSAHPHLRGKAFLDMVAARVAEKFPAQVTRRASPVESATTKPSPKGKQNYNSLPEEAKKAHDKFVKSKLMTSEEYLSSYFEG